jgi:hypothetical protein
MHDQKCCHTEHNHAHNHEKKHSESCAYTCPMTGFKFCWNSTVFMAMVVMVLWVSAFQWFWHTQMLHDLYNAHARLYRSAEEMEAFLPWFWVANALTGVVIAHLFAKTFQHSGCCEGLRFGIIMTLFAFAPIMVAYAVMPISQHLFHMWLAGAAIQFILAGIVLGSIFRCCHNKQCH